MKTSMSLKSSRMSFFALKDLCHLSKSFPAFLNILLQYIVSLDESCWSKVVQKLEKWIKNSFRQKLPTPSEEGNQ